MELTAVLAALLVLGFGSIGNAEELPSYIKVCHRSDPKLDDCIRKVIEEIRHKLPGGIPEFGIPSCEPLELKELVLDQGKGAISVSSSYSDVKIYGPSKFRLDNVKLDTPKKQIFIKLWFPYLHMTSQYKMNGRVLLMPITGNGRGEGNYTNIEASCTIKVEHVKKSDKIYINVKDFKVKLNIGHAKIQLDNLFNGNKQLGGVMNKFINENWRNVVKELKPLLEEKVGSLFKDFANNIFHKYSLDELLPP